MEGVGAALCAPERTHGPRTLWCLGSVAGASLLLLVAFGAVAALLEGPACACPVAAAGGDCPCAAAAAPFDCAWRCDGNGTTAGAEAQCFRGAEPVACGAW